MIGGLLFFLIIALVEAGMLWWLFGANRKLRKQSRTAGEVIDQANRILGEAVELDHRKTGNKKESDGEKQKVESLDNSELIDDANALFPGLPDK